MTLKISSNFPIAKYNIGVNKSANQSIPLLKADSFEPSFGKTEEKTSFFKRLFGIKTEEKEQTLGPANEFATRLSEGIKAEMGQDISPVNLENIMSPQEFRELLPTFNSEQFKRTDENVKAGIYSVDLDYQSNYSSGKDNVFEIMDKVAEYADEYVAKQEAIQAKNAAEGRPVEEVKPFIFSLCDRDCVEGLQHAIRIMGKDPDKFKNVKLVPAVKLTFAHKAPNSSIKYENSEMLVYGINPYSKNLINFVDTIIEDRKKMIASFMEDISQLYPEYSFKIIEFLEQNQLEYAKNYTVSNLYWRIREYAETKANSSMKGVSIPASVTISDTNRILSELGFVHVGSQKASSEPLGSDKIKKESKLNKTIHDVFRKYSTHTDEKTGRMVSAAEHVYNDMIDCLKKEAPNLPVLAIASPLYLSDYFGERNPETYREVVDFISELQDTSAGMLTAFESISPSYGIDNTLKNNTKTIRQFNKFLRDNTKLHEVGGSFAGVIAEEPKKPN